MNRIIIFALIAILLTGISLSNEVLNQAPKNVIILLCDGMGFNHQFFSELLAEKEGIHPATREFSTVALGLNHPEGTLITDSAAAATAIFRGSMTDIGFLGFHPEKRELESMGRFFKDKGWSTAIITNTRYYDATPAGLYATTFSRADVDKITQDLIDNDFIDVLVAGGLEELGVNPFTGKPKKNSDLYSLAQSGYEVLGINFKPLLPPEGPKRGTMAFLTMGDMNFEDDKLPDEPIFSEAVRRGLDFLGTQENIFAMIECGRVDDACHINADESLKAELIEFQRVLNMLLNRFPTDETLFIVLSDHETGGICLTGGYHDGSNITFNWGSSDHTGSYVPILSKGTGSEQFRGIFHIEEIFPKIKTIFNSQEED